MIKASEMNLDGFGVLSDVAVEHLLNTLIIIFRCF